MSQNPALKHLFSSPGEIDPEQQFGLSRRNRYARMRQILGILRRHKFFHGLTPVEFRAMIEELGPSFVKIGQMLSTRSEILPKVFCDELSNLQTECDPMPFEQVVVALQALYGPQCSEIFQEIDPHPLGSASLAQVHKAVLANGDVVAVKVQRPGVRITMAQDIDVMRSVARRLARFMPDDQMLDLRAVVEEMWATFLDETNFRAEANNLAEFALLNKDTVFVRCPKPYLELCTEESLVMEYIDGISIRDKDKLLELGYDLEEIGEKILDNYATQVLDHGFFHADPHPGNISILDGQVVYLDLGIMGRLSPRDRAGMGDIVAAVGQKNAGKLKDALFNFSESTDLAHVDNPRFLTELDNIINRYASCDVADIDIPAFLNDIMAVTRQCKVKLPSSVTSVARGLVTLEGTLSEYVGNFNMVEVINSHIMRGKSDPAQMKETLEGVMRDLAGATQGLITAAQYSGDAVRMLSRGQLKVTMNMTGSEESVEKLAQIAGRLTMGMIIAGLLVAAALVSSSTNLPLLLGLPWPSTVGFILAFVLLGYLFIAAIRKGR